VKPLDIYRNLCLLSGMRVPFTHAPHARRSQWSFAQREAARQRALSCQPWKHSTGPRSQRGKIISSRNAYKHGGYSQDIKDIRLMLRMMAMRLAILKEIQKTKHAAERKKSRNELSSRQTLLRVQKPCGMTKSRAYATASRNRSPP
jgi:hypothetical protein